MILSECVRQIREGAQLDSNLEAFRVARTSLTMLADCLPGPLTEEIAEELPPALAGDVKRVTWQPGERLTLSELVGRIASREEVTEAVARHHLGAVMEFLQEVLHEKLMSKVLCELPGEIGELVTADRSEPRMHQAAT